MAILHLDQGILLRYQYVCWWPRLSRLPRFICTQSAWQPPTQQKMQRALLLTAVSAVHDQSVQTRCAGRKSKSRFADVPFPGIKYHLEFISRVINSFRGKPLDMVEIGHRPHPGPRPRPPTRTNTHIPLSVSCLDLILSHRVIYFGSSFFFLIIILM